MAFAYQTASATARSGSARNGLTPTGVPEFQRRQILMAFMQAVKEVGYSRTTVAEIVGRAGVSRTTFYDFFANRQDCFLAAFREVLAEMTALARDTYAGESSWREGIRSALTRVLTAMDQDRRLARFLIVDSLAAGATVLRCRAQVLDELAQIIDAGRLEGGAEGERPQVTSELVVASALGLLYGRLLEEREEPLTDLLAPLMAAIVLPFFGAQTALRELRRPAPRSREKARTPRPVRERDSLVGLDVRLTYRTVRVLMALAERPGATNREIADGSGITDQGQISKLLARLECLNLVKNRRETGTANAWYLTPRGARLEQTVYPS
jgi:AcrR family transcriptional regulator/DNA-binding MarR family transcriptional regulator